MSPHPNIRDINLTGKRIFLRADLNIPLQNGSISDDTRLKALLPTINFIQKQGGKIILATHIGRPPAQSTTNYFDESLSTRHLLAWLKEHDINIALEPDIKKAITASHHNFSQILLLENLRFFNGEKNPSLPFAQLLHELGDIYINDAFSLLHREDTSVTFLAEQFESDKKTFGLLVEKELNAFEPLITQPEQPFVILVGGNKATTKLTALFNILQKSENKQPSTILLGGIPGLTVLAAQNYPTGSTPLNKTLFPLAQNIIDMCLKKAIKLVVPVDQIVEHDTTSEISTTASTDFPSRHHAIDIGPETIKLFCDELAQTKTAFATGPVGIYQNPHGQTGTHEVFKAFANIKGTTIIGGGDAAAAATKFGLDNKVTFISTGGGAALALLAAENPQTELPAMKSMYKGF